MPGCSTTTITAIPSPTAYSDCSRPPHSSRRWFYVSRAGRTVKLVHRIESHHLDSVPGSKMEYSAWPELQENLEKDGEALQQIVMQYSPNNQIRTSRWSTPGCMELIRSFGKEIVSSANLVARFEATLTDRRSPLTSKRERRSTKSSRPRSRRSDADT